MIILCFILLGIITGVLAGLLGIGGGVITVPALYLLLRLYGFPEVHIMHMAAATALAATLITSLGSTFSHHRKGAISISVLRLILPGLVLGCVAGAVLSSYLSSVILKNFFGVIAICFAVYFFFPKLPSLNIAETPNRSLTALGVLVGMLSSMLGIGGGIFMIPLLLGYKIPLTTCIANSSAGTLASACVGTIAYLIIAQGNVDIPAYTVGYVDIPAFLSIGLCSLCTTSFGSYLAHKLPHLIIKRIFSVVLGITGTAMILGS